MTDHRNHALEQSTVAGRAIPCYESGYSAHSVRLNIGRTAPCHKLSEADCPRYGSISNRKRVYKLPHVMQANRARPMTIVCIATVIHGESLSTGVNENTAQRHDDADSINAGGRPEFGIRRWTLPYLTDLSLIPSTTCCIGAKLKSASNRCKRSSVLCKLT